MQIRFPIFEPIEQPSIVIKFGLQFIQSCFEVIEIGFTVLLPLEDKQEAEEVD
jgi:hypothetical protein